MTTATEKMIQAIEYVVKPLSIGTNLALLHVIWAMVSGAFLLSRGAVHPALKESGRTDEEIRRGGAALRTGQWQIKELIERWREWVFKQGEWEVREYEGWRAVSCDVVVFPRLKLKGWIAKLYRGTFGWAVKAVGFGVIVDVGQYAGGRVALLKQLIRCQNIEKSEAQLKTDLLQAGAKALGEKGVLVHDAGATVKEMQAVGAARYVLRLARNCVARWSYLPEKAHGNRQYGDLIRPLARSRKGKEIASTDDPSETTSFEYKGVTIQVKRWRKIVSVDAKVADKGETYDIWVFLTRAIGSHCSWLPILTPQLRPFTNFILTDGLLSNCLWQPSK